MSSGFRGPFVPSLLFGCPYLEKFPVLLFMVKMFLVLVVFSQIFEQFLNKVIC